MFLLTTLLPDPEAARGRAATTWRGASGVDELRRARFLDLPRLVNVRPRDVRMTVEECVAHVAADDADARFCGTRLARIGGAAFPTSCRISTS